MKIKQLFLSFLFSLMMFVLPLSNIQAAPANKPAAQTSNKKKQTSTQKNKKENTNNKTKK